MRSRMNSRPCTLTPCLSAISVGQSRRVRRRAIGVVEAGEVGPPVRAEPWASPPQIDGALIAVGDAAVRIRDIDRGGERPQQFAERALAVLQPCLRLLDAGDVARDALQAQGAAVIGPHNNALDRDPALLFRVGALGGRYDPVLGPIAGAGAAGRGEQRVDPRQVLRVHEASGLREGLRHRPLVVSMNSFVPRIVLEPAGLEIYAPDAQLGAVERQLQPIVGVLQLGFLLATLGEQRGDGKRACRYREQGRLHRTDAAAKRHVRIAQVADVEGHAQDHDQTEDEHGSGGARGTTVRGRPKQNGKEQSEEQNGQSVVPGRAEAQDAGERENHERCATLHRLVTGGRIVHGLNKPDDERRNNDDAERVGRNPVLPDGERRTSRTLEQEKSGRSTDARKRGRNRRRHEEARHTAQALQPEVRNRRSAWSIQLSTRPRPHCRRQRLPCWRGSGRPADWPRPLPPSPLRPPAIAPSGPTRSIFQPKCRRRARRPPRHRVWSGAQGSVARRGRRRRRRQPRARPRRPMTSAAPRTRRRCSVPFDVCHCM